MDSITAESCKKEVYYFEKMEVRADGGAQIKVGKLHTASSMHHSTSGRMKQNNAIKLIYKLVQRRCPTSRMTFCSLRPAGRTWINSAPT